MPQKKEDMFCFSGLTNYLVRADVDPRIAIPARGM